MYRGKKAINSIQLFTEAIFLESYTQWWARKYGRWCFFHAPPESGKKKKAQRSEKKKELKEKQKREFVLFPPFAA
jgi:hypothetical protein